jgi:hypothetical protein
VDPANVVTEANEADNARGADLVAHHRLPVRIRVWVVFTPNGGHGLQARLHRLAGDQVAAAR